MVLANASFLITLLYLFIGNVSQVEIKTIAEDKSKPAVVMFEEHLTEKYESLNLQKYDLNFDVFQKAMIGYFNLKAKGKLSDQKLISIIDFTKHSKEKRYYVIDLENDKVLYHTHVAHGRKTGENTSTSFSNEMGSHQSSIGFYVTGETYFGSKGYSLRLDGMDKGYNDRMRDRAVVIHEANYVSESIAKSTGRVGRSLGCPALPVEYNKEIIDLIKDKTMIYAHYNDRKFASTSVNLKKDLALLSFQKMFA